MGMVKWTSRTVDTTEQPDTASRREEVCLLNSCDVAAQLLTSQPIKEDLTMTFISHSDVLGPSQIRKKKLASSVVHSALEHILCHIQLLQNRDLGEWRAHCVENLV